MNWCTPRGGRACPIGLPELSHALNHPGDDLAAQFDQILNLSGTFAPLLPLDQALTFWAPLDYTLNDLRGAPATFTRDSAAMWRRDDGEYFLLPSNQPRFEQGLILMEAASANKFVDPEAPATQSIDLALGNQTFSVHGSGSVTSSNDGGVATGHGTATEGAPVTINVTTAGTILFTVTGTPSIVQVEAAPAATSPIVTGTRAADILSYSGVANFLNQPQGMALVTLRSTTNHADLPAGSYIQGVLSVIPNTESLSRVLMGSGDPVVQTFDTVGSVSRSTFNAWGAEKNGYAAVLWGPTQLDIGFKREDDGPWRWPTPITYSGAFATDGVMRIAYDPDLSMRFADIRFYNENRGRSWVEENYGLMG